MYKPELMTNYTPWFNPVPALPLSFTDIKQGETVCLEISRDLIPYLLGMMELARWKDRFDGTPEEQAHSVGVFQDLVSAMITGNADCEPCKAPVKIVKGKEKNTWDMTIEDKMAVINIYECGCGCGGASSHQTNCGNGSGGGGGVSGGSGDSSKAISDVVVTPPPSATTSTLCDVVTGGMLDYILDQFVEFGEAARSIAGSTFLGVNAIIDAAEIVPVIGTLTDAGWDAIAEGLSIGVDAILDMLKDVDFRDQFKIAYIKGNPNSDGTNITRENLNNAVKKLPYTWIQGANVIFPRVSVGALVNVLRMDKVRRRLALYEGQSNPALCSFYYGEAGVAEPAAPALPSGERPPVEIGTASNFTFYELEEYRGKNSTVANGITTELVRNIPAGTVAVFFDITQTGGGGWGAELRNGSTLLATWANGNGFVLREDSMRALETIWLSVLPDFGGGNQIATGVSNFGGVTLTAFGVANSILFTVDHVYVMVDNALL